MRNPERIENVLSRIRRIWHMYPDLRLGQLLLNVVGPDHDLFYVEDDALLAMIDNYQKKLSGRTS